ncbi:MAG: NAD(P)-dependent alcohol dehydrogenase [Dokdonella sp.]
MKAALITRYGSPDVIQVIDVAKPTPEPGEVLVCVHAATVNRTDCGELGAGLIVRLIYGFWKPRRAIFGLDVAGVVEQVGAGVTRFRVGDRIFGMCPGRRNGAHAEYVCIPESGPITTLPASVGFDQAVVCEGAYYASATMTTLAVGPGTQILVYGASGAIGSAAVQLAKDRGAEVTAAVEARHLDLARSLGADHVFDCASDEFAALGRHFDIVYDSVGKMPIRQWRRLRKPDGIFATTDMGPWGQNLLAWLGALAVRSRRVVIPLPERSTIPAFLAELRERMEAGRYRAVIDRTYRLDEIADAYRYVMTGKKAGIVVIQVAEEKR